LIALNKGNGEIYLGWRWLSTDSPNIKFNLYRYDDGGASIKLNADPIFQSTNFIDKDVDITKNNEWAVHPVIDGREQEQSCRVKLNANAPEREYISIKLKDNYDFQKVGIADLNGDGAYDYVIKQPGGGIDPGRPRHSRDTYKIEAYNGKNGEFLWRVDLGWNINMGIWWSPLIVYDLDGDGKAEAAFKSAPYASTPDEAFIDANGFVLSGPEYCTVLDGLSGEEIDKVNWVARGDISDWGDDFGNRVNRNQIGIAFLDGKCASLLVCRGTYTQMHVHAYNLENKKLVPVWKWSGENESPKIRGQGMHGMHAVDLDDDGRDEIFLGSVVLDDNGSVLWCNNMGHPDIGYISDIMPNRPGLEIAYGYEDSQKNNGICVADAKTGEIIWGHPEPTTHIHDQGMLADIDPKNPGLEFYAAEKNRSGHWLYAVQTGKLLSKENLNTITPRAFYWLDGYTKVYSPFNYRARSIEVFRYEGGKIADYQGKIVAIADVKGDWREELIVSVKGELRIYTTTTLSTSRHICLMQDPLYRTDAALQSMGYLYPPQLQNPLSN
jgi:rhamnogalacturonan endolyase